MFLTVGHHCVVTTFTTVRKFRTAVIPVVRLERNHQPTGSPAGV